MSAENQVLAANRRFYTALENLDLDGMESVWLPENWVACVHPGWEMLTGWEYIRESWARIFENTRRMKLGISHVTVRVEAGTAWVNCIEQVTSSFETGFSTGRVQATNIFVKRNGEWYLVQHHASPIPSAEEETVQ